MCICVNCHYVDRCTTYHAVEELHRQPHLTDSPSFEAVNPTVNANIRMLDDEVEQEFDVVGCDSFVAEQGKWAKLRPGELVPT
ncbi:MULTISPECIES: Ycf34 family protein [Cyanophyceae]|uniref:Ycf34 family protein n=1 Tax=Cyanophyceae TaxID=3028117 RepID=UPI0016893155|nr:MULTISPECIES: Ycf34 family protein [Cyanophyceae]MBD1917554.1 Ycf34 family protein [Phormidium sp. FACHB-77]MBD2029571.1 Ycf34 family protein [Phormidium sp. FACHB-322]MBD2050832.1 Ycf34 family protein [Leptolyngbya sp. FACHB-60]